MQIMNSKEGRGARVLLVEDNEADVILTKEGFKASRISLDLFHVENGEECMKFLRREAPYEDVPRPDLVLLDLNLPRMDGRQVLAEIVADEGLRGLPVVVLTTSDADRDVLDMYDLRCSSYITKPVDFDDFRRVVEMVGDYWFTIVVTPKDAPG